MSDRPIAALQDYATKLRIHSVEATSAAGSGHPTSCASMAELTAALFFHTMKYHVQDPRNLANDRFVLSKGHAAPILYAAWAEAGLFPTADLVKLRKFDCDLEGHPTPRLEFVDVATGSLGQGLSAGCGIAYACKYLEKNDARTYVLMGDGEVAEGSVWEAANFASYYKLDNLVAIVDVNRLGQSQPTMFQHDMEAYRARWAAFGFNALVVDGHDLNAILDAFDQAQKTTGQPTAILAQTHKGQDLPGIADKDNQHGKALTAEATNEALTYLRGKLHGAEAVKPSAPTQSTPYKLDPNPIQLPALNYTKGQKIATRKAYGEILAKLGEADRRIIGLDGDVKNSTFAQDLKAVRPEQFIECFIAEQNLVGVGVALGTRGFIPFVSTFAAFLSRAFDQIRMAGISLGKCTFVGSHSGVSIGEDGPSQMALEDLAMFRCLPGGVVFYPSDAVSCAHAVALAANFPGLAFIRTSRPATTVIYGNDDTFAIGQAKVVRRSDKDKITVIGAGITLETTMQAAEQLAAEGIDVRVIDPFTIKPLDRATILANARETGGKILTVEDHYPEGGIGDAVAGELASETDIQVHKIAVDSLPRSGQPEELLTHYKLDSAGISAKIKSLL